MEKITQLIEWLEEEYLNTGESPTVAVTSIAWRILEKAREIEETKPIELPREYPADILSSESDIKIHTLTKSLREVIKVVNKLNNK